MAAGAGSIDSNASSASRSVGGNVSGAISAQLRAAGRNTAGESTLRGRRALLNGIVTIDCSMPSGAHSQFQFPATYTVRQIKAALCDAVPSLLAFQPKQLELSLGSEPLNESQDFERFVSLNDAVLDTYVQRKPIAVSVSVPTLDNSQRAALLSQFTGAAAAASDLASSASGDSSRDSSSASDKLEKLARSKVRHCGFDCVQRCMQSAFLPCFFTLKSTIR